MKRLFILLLGFMFATSAFAQNDNRDFNGYRWYDDGITFIYPLSVADDVMSRFTPASAGAPEVTRIIFEDYYSDNRGWLPTGAELHIIPVSTIPADRPDLLNSAIETAAQSLSLYFQTGSGMRFVVPSTSESGKVQLEYRFQGRTSDDLYVVNAHFPLTTDRLKEDSIADIQALDALAETDFSPGLTIIDALIRSLSVRPPEAMFQTAQTTGHIDYAGVSFDYDRSLAYRIEADTFTAIDEVEISMYGATPGYMRFTFVGFPVTGANQPPELQVMPVSQFPRTDQPYGAMLLELQTLLAERPELSSAAAPGSENALPIIPLINAAQTIVSQPQYIRFANGEGLRYIAHYSQESAPLNADGLFYTFAGISDDGQYVVAATFPLFAGFLPQGRTVYEIADYEHFSLNYQTYLAGLLVQIDSIDNSAYLPQIQLLDVIVSSVSLKGR